MTMKMTKRAGAVVAAAALLTLAGAPAFAATVSQATAQAIDGQLLGMPLVGTGQSTAVNDGSTPTVTVGENQQLQVLPGQTLLNDGVIAQKAVANDDGTSAACAGVLGEGGTITIGQSGTCTPDNGTAPFLLNLGDTPLGTLTLAGSAIYASCTAGPSDDGGFSADSTLVNVELRLGATVIPINADGSFVLPAALAPLLTLELNQTDSTGPMTSATALHLTLLSVLGQPLTDITIGHVECGPNATIAAVPMIPADGAVWALGTLALGAVVVFVVYRRRTTVEESATNV